MKQTLPEWADQCRECANFVSTLGGKHLHCKAEIISLRPKRIGWVADARKPNGICGPHGGAFKPSQPKDDECPYDCPDCGKKLTVIKGLWGCLCKFGGKFPSPAKIERLAREVDKTTKRNRL